MKKGLILAAACLAAASVLGAQDFSFKLTGGASYATLGDFAKGLSGQSDYLRDEYLAGGDFKAPALGFGGSAEIVFHFRPNLGLGLGAGFFRHSAAGTMTYDVSFISVQETTTPTVQVVPLTLNLHYYLPAGPALTVDLWAGGGYYLSWLSWDYRFDTSLLGFSGYDLYAFKGVKGGIGFQGGLGLEYALGPGLALVLNVSGRYASIGDWSGDWSEEGGGDFWEYADSGTGHAAWAFDWEYGGRTYAQILFQADEPAAPAFSNVRPAKLDLTGVTASIGIRIRI